MNMPFWRNWIFLWALLPVFSAFFGMASHRILNDTLPVQTHHTWGINIVFFSSAILFVLLPFFVLKRHFPGYGPGAHLLACLGAISGWVVFFLLGVSAPHGEGLFGLDKGFALSVMRAQFDSPILLGDILALPWGGLLLTKVAKAALVFSAPVFVLCVVARRASSFLWVMLFVVLASAAVAISDAFFEIARQGYRPSAVLNNYSWPGRFAIIGSWSVSSMIGASISAIGVGVLLRPDSVKAIREQEVRSLVVAGLRLAGLTVVLLWSVSFALQYTVGSNGYSSGFAALRKLLIAPPREDLSAGESIIAFSHLLDVETFSYPNSYYVEFDLSPDRRSAVVVEAHGKNGSRLAAFDIATGKRLATLSPPLTKYESVSFIWTKDQQHLLVRTRGKPVMIGVYTRYETKLALYSVPAYEPVAQWQPTETSCWNSDVHQVSMVEDDDGNLAVLCFGSDADADGRRPLAVMFALPMLTKTGVRTYEGNEADGQADRLMDLGGSVYAPIVIRGDKPGVVLANIVSPKFSVTFDDPFAPDRGGDLTFQDFANYGASSDMIGMRFCGETDKVSNPPRNATDTPWGPSFCRTVKFETDDGSYIGQADDRETRGRRDSGGPKEFSIASGLWRFTSVIDPSSRTGELMVSGTNRAVVQRLESSAQIPLVASGDPGLLFTYRVDERTIAVYKISRQ